MAAVFARWVAGVVVLLMMRPAWAQESTQWTNRSLCTRLA